MVMFIGTWADILPIRIIFSPVSGWKAESYTYFALHNSFSVRPAGTIPCLENDNESPSHCSVQRSHYDLHGLQNLPGLSERWWELWFLIIFVFWVLGLNPELHTYSVCPYHWSSWQPKALRTTRTWLQWTSQTHAPQLPVIWKITESNTHTKEYSAWKYSLS